MICKHCMKNMATVKFTEVVNGQAVQHHLCAPCYEAHQRENAGFSMEVPKPRQQNRERAQSTVRGAEATRCPSCGVLLSRILESGTVGCAACYTAFGTEIEAVLEALHRGSAHRGKSYVRDDARAQLAADLQARRLMLRAMLKEEKYEEAARLRDEIAQMETQARTGGLAAERGTDAL